MVDSSAGISRTRNRPRAKVFLRIDLENAYARLGVSPLASAEEIAARITELRGKAMKVARAKAQRTFGDVEEEIHRLDQIHDDIGDENKRRIYDEQHPQNILLTVQPSLAEQVWQRHRKAASISEWLCENLSEDAFLPSLRCLRLWNPNGLAGELLSVLSSFTDGEPIAAVEDNAHPMDEPAIPVSPDDLERLSEESCQCPTTTRS
ncbi:MAG TPA: hypothetical protein VN851_18495 [Thermoanaerobaculia bacterium]|nr:hypothetical protein [Thermoanaerobaculia bacterium]